ncbi:MAG TPA: alpha/beta fold hydrolase [Rectinemataceae bacterium]|nr:alpha/beta fold hydrolase [Rectinemataceae bacterium]
MHSSIETIPEGGEADLVGLPMAPWPALGPLGRFLKLPSGKGRLFYFDSAAGKSERRSVVLVHGLGDEGDSFRHLFPLLSGDFRLLAVDLPGFGRSEAGGGTSVGLCVEAVAALLEAEGIEGAIVVGSSLGAAIAQLLALRCPTRVGALLLEDGGSPAPGKPPSSLLAMALPLVGRRRYEGYKGHDEAAVRSLFPYYADWAGLPSADREFLSRRVAERVNSATQERAYISLLRSAMFTTMTKTRVFSGQLASWRKPMAVVWGAGDIVVPESAGRALAGQVGGASFDLVEGAGHLPHQERPEAVAAIIRDLAARIAG